MNAADTSGVSPAPPSPFFYMQEQPEGEQEVKYPLFAAVELLNSVRMERVKDGYCERCGYQSRKYEERFYLYTEQVEGKNHLRQNPKYSPPKHEIESDSRHESTLSRLRGGQPDELAWILAYLMADDTDRFFDALRRNPEILLEKEIWDRTVMRWFKDKLAPDYQSRNVAQTFLKEIGKALAGVISGNVTHITDSEETAIAAACEKWFPICQDLNKAFKELWKLPEYRPRSLFKKEAHGRLAEKFKIDVGDVKAIETYLQAPSRSARKSTPFSAMLRMVARKHFPLGDVSRHVKTIEKIYQKRRPRNSVTTPSAGERTA